MTMTWAATARRRVSEQVEEGRDGLLATLGLIEMQLHFAKVRRPGKPHSDIGCRRSQLLARSWAGDRSTEYVPDIPFGIDQHVRQIVLNGIERQDCSVGEFAVIDSGEIQG